MTTPIDPDTLNKVKHATNAITDFEAQCYLQCAFRDRDTPVGTIYFKTR